MTQVEFYLGDSERHIAVVRSGAVPRQGEFVNIRKVTYEVELVTWAVDHPSNETPQLRANVVLRTPQ